MTGYRNSQSSIGVNAAELRIGNILKNINQSDHEVRKKYCVQ